jgi:hypothetical protein
LIKGDNNKNNNNELSMIKNRNKKDNNKENRSINNKDRVKSLNIIDNK